MSQNQSFISDFSEYSWLTSKDQKWNRQQNLTHERMHPNGKKKKKKRKKKKELN